MKNSGIVNCFCAVAIGLFSATIVFGQQEKCLMEPEFVAMETPVTGFRWISGDDINDKCDSIPASGWESLPCGDFDLMVHTSGPFGSLREWNIFVGVGPKNIHKPTRGFCLSTSTVGWRTLQTYPILPLPWIGDRDHDGNAELIIWSSFPLREEASLAEFGVIAWVYKIDKNKNFIIDLKSSRILAGEIATAYRKSLGKPNSGYLQDERNNAACFLERFANAQCTLKIEEGPK
jgi:hypothetical protein